MPQSQLSDVLAGLGKGIGDGLAAIPQIERQTRLDKLALERHRREQAEEERKIAKERLGIARTDAQAAITGGNYQRADEIMRPQIGNYNTVMGTNNVGDKLIG